MLLHYRCRGDCRSHKSELESGVYQDLDGEVYGSWPDPSERFEVLTPTLLSTNIKLLSYGEPQFRGCPLNCLNEWSIRKVVGIYAQCRTYVPH